MSLSKWGAGGDQVLASTIGCYLERLNLESELISQPHSRDKLDYYFPRQSLAFEP